VMFSRRIPSHAVRIRRWTLSFVRVAIVFEKLLVRTLLIRFIAPRFPFGVNDTTTIVIAYAQYSRRHKFNGSVGL
jgi:hypothetical protein